MTMAPKVIKKKQGHNESQDDRKQEPVLASGEYRDLATMSAFRLEKGKGKGATLISKGCAKSTRDIIEWKRENSREAMMVERGNMQAITHPAKCQESRWSHPYKAHGMLTSGHRVGEAGGQNHARWSFESPMEVQMPGVTYLENWNSVSLDVLCITHYP